MERPAATAIANGPELFGNHSETKHSAPAKGDQAILDEIAAYTGAPGPGEIDWHDPEQVLIPEQPPIAVYPNTGGTLTIRQRQWPDDDAIITVAYDCLGSLIEGLQRFLPGNS